MRHRSPARWLAPLALVTCAVAAYAVVQGSSSSDGTTTKRSTTPARTTTSHRTTTRPAAHQPATYVVKAGDVLSAIAQKTGVSVQELQALNPSVDPAALQPGQKLRLRAR